MDPILSTWKSITLLIVSFAVMFVGILYLGAPSTIVLIFAGVSVIILSVVWGVRWKKIEDDLLHNLKAMLQPILIL
ncbi:hypothetical protein B4102_2344 [Heyndrickxia sporothermodurans]|uniref:Uncharacterized protein n=1 Tax=Heyndrickxia sporothermodurans TaxID=46224 RepID=A0A150LEH2_9BACI|nr:hypothetical protein [Heyndrickxia sporothermodurans]KYD10409.1 hypothetical protein B4102_2344 [Heyndrickxia sporothermodurans]